MSETTLRHNERVVRHPNGHLMIEECPPPSQEQIDKAFASIDKAWPYLAKHADHIDGEFNLAVGDLRRIVARLQGFAADTTPAVPERGEVETTRLSERIAWVLGMTTYSNEPGQVMPASLSHVTHNEFERQARALLRDIAEVLRARPEGEDARRDTARLDWLEAWMKGRRPPGSPTLRDAIDADMASTPTRSERDG